MNIMDIRKLRDREFLQAHHWQAAQWLAEVPRGDPALAAIKADCREIALRSTKFEPRAALDPFALLVKTCVHGEGFEYSDHLVGSLREALNVVHRQMKGRVH